MALSMAKSQWETITRGPWLCTRTVKKAVCANFHTGSFPFPWLYQCFTKHFYTIVINFADDDLLFPQKKKIIDRTLLFNQHINGRKNLHQWKKKLKTFRSLKKQYYKLDLQTEVTYLSINIHEVLSCNKQIEKSS